MREFLVGDRHVVVVRKMHKLLQNQREIVDTLAMVYIGLISFLDFACVRVCLCARANL